MKYQRKPTKVQKLMIALMGVATGALLMWAVPEVMGAVSPAAEDTYSEWVWDLPLGAIWALVSFHVVAGILFIWSAGHFLEGYKRRRDREKRGN